MKNMKKLLLAGVVVVSLCGSNTVYGMTDGESKAVRMGSDGKPATEVDEDEEAVERDEESEEDEDEQVDDSGHDLATRTRRKRPMFNEISHVMSTTRTKVSGYVDNKEPLSGETFHALIRTVRRELEANLRIRSSDDDGVADLDDDRKIAADRARDNWISECLGYAYFQLDALLLGSYNYIDFTVYKNNGDSPVPYSYDTLTNEQRAQVQKIIHDMEEERRRAMGTDWRKFVDRQKKSKFKDFLAQRDRLLIAHEEKERELAPAREAAKIAAREAKAAERREKKLAADRAREDERRRADEYREIKANSDKYLTEKAERERVAQAIATEREKIRLKTQRCRRFQQAGSVALSALFASLAINSYESPTESWFGGASNFDL